jgi:flagellar basal-body rod protein FlgB
MSLYLNNSFGKTIDILHRSMSANIMRQEVIANNIANSDTPNFKRSVVNFESSLARAIKSEETEKEAMQATMTDPRHMPFYRAVDYQSVEPRRVLDFTTASKNNGNNVDIEEETANAVAAQLSYNLMVQSMTGEFNNINLVLRG